MFYIIGSGGFAKEVLLLLKQTKGSLSDFGGFIDLSPKSSFIYCLGKECQILSEDFFLKNQDQEDTEVFIGVGDPKIIEKIISKYDEFNFPNLIASNVIIDESVKLGVGNIIASGCIFTVDINIGSFNVFNLQATIGHDSIIRNGNIFNPGVNISGSVNVGCYNLFGTNSAILQGLNVGNRSIIGASSLINKNVGDHEVVVGVPGKMIKKNN